MDLKSVYNVRKIVLMLGTACNFNCIYCVQHDNKPRFKKAISPEVMEWLSTVAYALPMKLKPTIHFYGGEPLLYKDSIHQVIDRFGDDFGYLISSNGSYLTDEDVEYFNAHDVQFVLSNDGPNTKVTRQIDMLEDEAFLSRFNRLKHRGVDSVVSALTQDFYGVYDYVESKSPGCSVFHEELVCGEITDPRLPKFDHEVLLKSYKRMGDELIDFQENGGTKSNGATIFNQYLKQALFCLNHPAFPDFGMCGSGKSVVNVDVQGNIYLCKNFNVKVGTIKDSYETLYDRAKDEVKKLRDANLEAKGCFECPAFYFCRGGCPFEKPSDAQKQKCDMIRTKWASVVSFIDNKTELEVRK